VVITYGQYTHFYRNGATYTSEAEPGVLLKESYLELANILAGVIWAGKR